MTKSRSYRSRDGSYSVIYSNGIFKFYGYGAANSLNDNGQIAGFHTTFLPPIHRRDAMRYTLFDETVLNPLIADGDSYALDMNNAGVTVGESRSEENVEGRVTPWRAIVWNGTTPTDLGTLGDNPFSRATGINSSGQIVGTSHNLTPNHGFLYEKGSMRDLGFPPGYTSTTPSDINDSGVIVGHTGKNGGEVNAFTYLNGRFSIVLPDLNLSALRINSQGDLLLRQMPDHHNEGYLVRNGSVSKLRDLLTAESRALVDKAPPNMAGNGELYPVDFNDSGQILAKVSRSYYDSICEYFLLSPIAPIAPGGTRVIDNSLSVRVKKSGSSRRISRRKKILLRGRTSGKVSAVTVQIGRKSEPLVAKGTRTWRLKVRVPRGSHRIIVRAVGLDGSFSPPKRIRVVRR